MKVADILLKLTKRPSFPGRLVEWEAIASPVSPKSADESETLHPLRRNVAFFWLFVFVHQASLQIARAGAAVPDIVLLLPLLAQCLGEAFLCLCHRTP